MTPLRLIRSIRGFRRFSTAATALVLLGAVCSGAPDPSEGARPNIVFIMADDLGYGDVGCYGQSKIKTPNIDRLAAQGTRFTNLYAGAPMCAPSRNVLMTDEHTGHCRIRGNSPRVGGEIEYFGEGNRRLSLTDKDRTVAEVMREAGYVTGAIGKWGLGEPGSSGTPNRRGFDEWFGYLNQNHAPYYYTDYLWKNHMKQVIPENLNGQRRVYTQDLFTGEAMSFLQRHRERPFFLYLPFSAPHRRFEVPSLDPYGKKDWPEDAKIYAAMITRLDRDVGTLLAEVDRLGLASNTLVFFCSDNGAESKKFGDLFRSNGELRGHKFDLYEGAIRVPMIVRWTGVTPAGAVSAATWWFADILPTFSAIAGAAGPIPTTDGVSVLPTLRGGSQPELENRFLYWEDPSARLMQAAIRGRWKAIRADRNVPLELYDLRSDAGETRNLAATLPKVLGEFRDYLVNARVSSPYWPD